MSTRGTAPERRFAPLGFEQHYENMRLIEARDVLLPSLGGAGSSLVANLLLEADLAYVDLAKDVLLPDGSWITPIDSVSQRLLPRQQPSLQTTNPALPRFMKTHLPADEFTGCAARAIWLLVRDPRDALYSWHRYHREFAELEWEEVPDSFAEFLRVPFFTGHRPVEGWASFYAGWLSRGEHDCRVEVLRFEDLKRDSRATMRQALVSLGLTVDAGQLARAAQRSSYQAMRAHEDSVVACEGTRQEARVLRSGTVEEWRSWMTPELEPYFSDDRFRAVATRLGYDCN